MSIADELITRGWAQDIYYDAETGRVCLFGAAAFASGLVLVDEDDFTGLDYEGQIDDACTYATEALAQAIGLPLTADRTIAEWNDDPARTFDDVLRVAKIADELLDAEA